MIGALIRIPLTPWFLAATVVALVALVTLLLLYNRLVRLRNLVQEAWSGIDVQLKRRHELVPPLVDCVRAYAAHERDVFDRVTALRSRLDGAKDIAEQLDAENGLTDAVRRLFAVAEAYPALRADRSFAQLQEQLVEIEDHIQMARRYYNGAARNYNIRVESFPDTLVARLGRFRRAEFFQIVTTSERAAPEVALQ